MLENEKKRSLDELRQRLYERGGEVSEVERHTLNDSTAQVAKTWATPPAPPPPPPPAQEPSRAYRKIVLLTSIGIFLLVAALSAAYFFFGNNRITSDNITFSIAGNTNISGGEIATFQVGVTNQNTVAVEGAALIVTYPEGTLSATEPRKRLFEDRIDIGTLAPGEVKNIQIQAALYGKENQQSQISATLEYRLVGSDGVFYKDASPISIRIVSSPLLLKVDTLRRVSAGQPVVVALSLQSNTQTPLRNILVTAEFPDNFIFKAAEPAPLYGKNVWKIDELKPESVEYIKIEGSVEGLANEAVVIDFSAGSATKENEFIVGALLAEARTELVIEQPFLSVGLNIAGDSDRSVVLDENQLSVVDVTIKNTLTEPVYDMVVEVVPTGNVLSEASIDSRQGFYDSNKGSVIWDRSNMSDFIELQPNETRRVGFAIIPQATNSTAAFNVAVNVYARRTTDPGAAQQLIGSVTAEARYASVANITSSLTTVAGSPSPKVGEVTTYLATVLVSGGNNNVTNAQLKTSLPNYITWKDEYSGKGSVSYNPVSREITWNIGDIVGGTQEELTFLVDFLPSFSQVGITPIIVNDQSLQALDRFTNSPATAVGSSITSEQLIDGEKSGTVIQ